MTFLLIGSAIYIALGLGHGILILVSNVFEPLDRDLLTAMKTSSPRITKSTSLWHGGVGFHLSHSLGLIVTGFLAAYVGIEFISNYTSLTIFHYLISGISVLYLILSIRYWFILPSIGFAISTVCFVGWCLSTIT